MGKIIAISNQKGGVGKTTTAINLSSGLAQMNKKVLLVDFDSQGNASQGLLAITKQGQPTIYSVLLEDYPIEDAIVHKEAPNIDILPSSISLAGADLEMDKMEAGKEELLKRQLMKVRNQYDYIIIDCPPALGILTTNALASSDSVLIPVQCEYFALEGVTQLLNTIILTQTKVNPKLDIEGVLLTMLDGRTLVGLEVVEDVRKFFKEKVFNTIIPRLVRLIEAPSHGKPIIEYDPKCRGALAYINLAKEVIERNAREEESVREGSRTTVQQ